MYRLNLLVQTFMASIVNWRSLHSQKVVFFTDLHQCALTYHFIVVHHHVEAVSEHQHTDHQDEYSGGE